MDVVEFITIQEDGSDLVLSFSFKEDTEFGVDGFIIQRSPQFEFILPRKNVDQQLTGQMTTKEFS
jgi:hypothetical protein